MVSINNYKVNTNVVVNEYLLEMKKPRDLVITHFRLKAREFQMSHKMNFSVEVNCMLWMIRRINDPVNINLPQYCLLKSYTLLSNPVNTKVRTKTPPMSLSGTV